MKSEKTVHRDKESKRKLINRLKRIEGQVKGIIKMVENDAYCPDVLMQTSAVSSAINAFNRDLISKHIKTCVLEDVKEGNDEVLDELVITLQRLMK